jgi:hypothetical protein
MPVKKVSSDDNKTKDGTLCVAPQLGWRKWLFPKHAAVQCGTLNENSAYHVTMRDGINSEYTLEKNFFTQAGAQKFEIEDTNLREKFLENLQKTGVEFKVAKSFHKIPSDFFKSEKSREDDVAEAVAKYYYNSHHNPAIVSKMFCSQFVFQNLQNALVEKSCEDKDNKLGNEITEPFEVWKKNHIDAIKKAVEEFPPELKHVSSAVTPNGLASILSKVAERGQEGEAGKPTSETANIFSRMFRGLVNFFEGKDPAGKEEGKVEATSSSATVAVTASHEPSAPSTTASSAAVPCPSCRALSWTNLVERFVGVMRGR